MLPSAEDRPVQQHRDASRRTRSELGGASQEQLLRRLLRGAVRAHAEDEDPGVADRARSRRPSLDRRPAGQRAASRRSSTPAHAEPEPAIGRSRRRPRIQNFVNQGGRYIGTLHQRHDDRAQRGPHDANTAGDLRAGLRSTPGSTSTTARSTRRARWRGAYDDGGWIYRDLGGNADLQPGHAGRRRRDPGADGRRRYGDVRGNGLMYKYGFDVNARGAAQLAGRPAVIDQPFGSGRALLIGVNPFYRAWIDGEERIVAQRHPVPDRRAGGARRAAGAQVRRGGAQPAAAPIAPSRAAGGQAAAPIRAARSTGPRRPDRGQAHPVHAAQGARSRRRGCSKAPAQEGPLRVHAARRRRWSSAACAATIRTRATPGSSASMDGSIAAKRKVRPSPRSSRRLGSGRAGAPPALPAPCTALTAGGLVWSGPSGRSAGVALRGVREGCRPLGHSGS